MGGSISTVIAKLVMEDLEETIIAKRDINPPFFFRFVDDCITTIPKKI